MSSRVLSHYVSSIFDKLVWSVSLQPLFSSCGRFRVWLQSRTRRDLHNGLVTASERCQEVHVEPQEELDPAG